MTVSSTNRKAGPYYGNGVTAAFPFSFKVFAASDLLVVKTNLTTGVDTVLAATDYSVSLTADTTGGYSSGTVTLTAGALASGYTLTISSSILYTQNTDLTNNGGFYPKVINSALDRLTILCQQLLEQVSRSLKLSISTPPGVTPTLPTPVKNNMIAWNANGDGLQNLDPQALATIVAFGTANSDKFSGDGTTTQFVLSNNPGSLNNLDVSIGGVTQRPGIDYNWSAGTVITFTTAPATGTNNILVRYMQGLPQGYTTSDLVQYGSSNVKDALDAINLPDYAALRAYTGSARSVYITGYLTSAAPSGIAGWFTYDPSDTASADNGGTIIVDNAGRRWKRQYSGYISVLWFGAVGNGVADDAAAIQSAINYIGTLGGGVMQVPAGNFLLKSSLTPCNYLTVQGQTTGLLGGASPSCSFFIAQNTTGAFSAASVIKFCIRDIGFAAQGSGVGTAYAYKQTNLSVYSERCEFYNVNVWANLAGGFLGNFILTTWRRCEFGYYSTASGQFWPIYSKGQISGNQTNANLIEDCYILNSLGSYTVYFEAGSDITIRNTRFERCFGVTTVNFAGVLTSTIDGCYFEDSNGVGTLAPIAYGNDTTNAQGCSSINFFGNYGSLSSNNTHLIAHSGASGSINAIGNRFEGLTGKHFIISSGYGNDAPLASYLGNVTPGFSDIQEGVVNTSGSFSPTVASYAGTITSYSASASWSKVGKLAFLTAQVTITNNGTGATLLQITGLPAAITPDFSTVIAYAGTGINHSSGKSLSVEIQSAGTATVNVYLYDGTYPVATGNVIELAIQFRTTN